VTSTAMIFVSDEFQLRRAAEKDLSHKIYVDMSGCRIARTDFQLASPANVYVPPALILKIERIFSQSVCYE